MHDPLTIERAYGDAPFHTHGYVIEAIAADGRRVRREERDTLKEAKRVGEHMFFEEASSTRVYLNRPRGEILVAASDGRCTGPSYSHRVTWRRHSHFKDRQR